MIEDRFDELLSVSRVLDGYYVVEGDRDFVRESIILDSNPNKPKETIYSREEWYYPAVEPDKYTEARMQDIQDEEREEGQE